MDNTARENAIKNKNDEFINTHKECIIAAYNNGDSGYTYTIKHTNHGENGKTMCKNWKKIFPNEIKNCHIMKYYENRDYYVKESDICYIEFKLGVAPS